MLKQKGYATWALGKWHLGFLTDQFTPTARGFDTYVGYYSRAEEHFTHEKAGLGLNVYDLTNNSGASLNPLLSMVGNASATYSSYIYGTFFFFPFFSLFFFFSARTRQLRHDFGPTHACLSALYCTRLVPCAMFYFASILTKKKGLIGACNPMSILTGG